MASSPETKRRIATSVLLAPGFFDALAGRFLFVRETPPEKTEAGHPTSSAVFPPYTTLRGALHVHSTYSDGAGDIPTVMAEACLADVDFVLLTDHNTQKPLRDGWEARYNDRPMLLIGTEVTVESGAFLLALAMPPDWEPTKHQPPQVTIDEINELDGIPLISLPFDVKHPWHAWDVRDCVGLEVVNLSTIARRHINIPSLLWLLPIHKKSGVKTVLQTLLTRPDAELARWDRLTANGKTAVGIGALDAHALMKIGKRKYPIPSYADSLGVVTTHFLIPPVATTTPNGEWTRDAHSSEQTRQAIYAALRAGRCYIAYDALGDPRPLSFTAESGTNSAIMGERIVRASSGVTLRASCCPPGERRILLRLYHQGRAIANSANGQLQHTVTRPGAYRVEVYRYTARFGPLFVGVRPWAFTNPIYVE